ncbi:hypothetical protein, partial [uncultured Thiohalocapsa sp.]|uniref:nSTAND1 domain-containing NTPase n=1 Tax=uncultured Thiohalocapsa sp. TaxID=768990 RepID=UPI0025CFDF0C
MHKHDDEDWDWEWDWAKLRRLVMKLKQDRRLKPMAARAGLAKDGSTLYKFIKEGDDRTEVLTSETVEKLLKACQQDREDFIVRPVQCSADQPAAWATAGEAAASRTPPALPIQLIASADALHEATELAKRLHTLAADLGMPESFEARVSIARTQHPEIDPAAKVVIAVLGCSLGTFGSEDERRARDCWEALVRRFSTTAAESESASSYAIVYRREWRDCAPNARNFDDRVAFDAATEAAREFQTWADALLEAATAHALPGQTHGLTCIAYNQDETARLADRLAGDLVGLVEALLPALSAASGAGETDTAGAERWTAGSPFRGLLPLTDDYALVFKGWGWHVDELMKLLRNPQTRFVAVEGASGSGKSSLVWAGLLPRLARGGEIEGSEHWLAVRFVPTDRPFNELATQLSAHSELKGHWPNPGPLADQLRRPLGGFADVLRQALAGRHKSARLLLFVDQFEELFTMPAADGAADGPPWPWEPFVALLSDAAAEDRARVVVTMRREFASRVSDTPELAALFNQARYALPMPSQAERERMILEPARLAGLRLPADVAAEIVRDTGDEPGALAMMAHTLAALVAPEAQPECPADEVLRRLQALEPKDFRLRLDKMHGAKGAIAASAEQALDKFREAHGGQCAEEALALLFGKLVQVADLDKPPTRWRAPKALLGPADGPAAKLAALLEDDARLLVSDGPSADTAPEASADAQADDPAQRVATIEVAHEALLTHWDSLATWIDARKDKLWLRHRLAGLTQLWLAHDCHRGYLAAAVQVDEMRDAMAALGEALTP